MSHNERNVNRRDFAKALGGAATLAALSGRTMAGMFAGPTPANSAETAVKELYGTLTDKQKEAICFGFNNKLRKKINPNWNITDPYIESDFYTDKQRTLINQVVKGVTSTDGYELLQKQMDDDSGGIGAYSVAIFGKPGEGKFEFELTGRHLTLRADGNSVAKTAFGGPIVYGHGEDEPKSNLFYNQTLQANEVFKALDKDQAAKALVSSKVPKETAVQIQGEGGQFAGLSLADLEDDQKTVFRKTMGVLMSPYREDDRKEILQIVDQTGGIEALHMAFYQKADLENDRIWDVWRVEGPAFVWHFRGAPHVHAYINIAHRKVS